MQKGPSKSGGVSSTLFPTLLPCAACYAAPGLGLDFHELGMSKSSQTHRVGLSQTRRSLFSALGLLGSFTLARSVVRS